MYASTRLLTSLGLLCALVPACFNASDSGVGDDGMLDEGSTGDLTDAGDDATPDPQPDPDPGTTTGAPDPDGTTTGPADDSGGDTDPDPTTGGEVEDTTAPTVLMSAPADGDIGVAADVVMSVTFSEPMNKASVQAAYQSTDIPDLFVTMSWNAAGDQLIITPSNELLLGTGTSSVDITPRSYAFTITTAATDLAGNELEQDVPIEFTMLNRIHEQIDLLGALSGRVREDGNTAFGFIQAGDSGNPPNAQYRGFASFPMYDLPADIVEITEANLLSTQYAVAGSPYTDLGDLQIHDIEFFTLGLESFSAPSLGNLGVLSNSTANGQRALDVTAAVIDDYEAGSDTTQFAYQFPLTTNLDSGADYVLFYGEDSPATVLDIEYLLP